MIKLISFIFIVGFIVVMIVGAALMAGVVLIADKARHQYKRRKHKNINYYIKK